MAHTGFYGRESFERMATLPMPSLLSGEKTAIIVLLKPAIQRVSPKGSTETQLSGIKGDSSQWLMAVVYATSYRQ